MSQRIEGESFPRADAFPIAGEEQSPVSSVREHPTTRRPGLKAARSPHRTRAGVYAENAFCAASAPPKWR